MKPAFSPFIYLRRAFRRGKLAIASSLLFLMVGFGRVNKATAEPIPIHGKYTASMQQEVLQGVNSAPRRALVTIESVQAKGTKAPVVKQQNNVFSHEDVVTEVQTSLQNLAESISGAKLDTLILLIVTSTIIPLFKTLNISPIIGFLMTGTLLGPSGLSWVKDVHMIDHLGELGIVHT